MPHMQRHAWYQVTIRSSRTKQYAWIRTLQAQAQLAPSRTTLAQVSVQGDVAGTLSHLCGWHLRRPCRCKAPLSRHPPCSPAHFCKEPSARACQDIVGCACRTHVPRGALPLVQPHRSLHQCKTHLSDFMPQPLSPHYNILSKVHLHKHAAMSEGPAPHASANQTP